MSKYTYILDPAHGKNVAGKRSPDGKHREYLWSRWLIESILVDVRSKHYDFEYPLQDEENEIGLSTRKSIYNGIQTGKPKIVISFHNNAAGMGNKWTNARGFSAYTSKGQTKSDTFAEIMIDQFIKRFPNLRTRIETIDGDKDYEANFTVLMGNYFAILLEILFQDNIEDVIVLNSPAFLRDLVDWFYASLEIIEKN